MNSIQESLFEAMQAFSKKSMEQANSTIVIECTIKSIEDAGKNTYKVTYNNNDFVVRGNENSTYKINSKVNVLIPNGDFSSEGKIILSTASIDSITEDFTSNNEYREQYREISENLIDIGIEDVDFIELSSYEKKYISKNIIDDVNKESFNKEFNEYYNTYSNFKFSAELKTDLLLEQQNIGGNYGVVLSIPVLVTDEENPNIKKRKLYNVTLDTKNILGNPYRLYEWSPQAIYFDIPDEYEYDITSVPFLTYFCEGFKEDIDKINIKDIFIKNPSLIAVEEIPEDNNDGYFLSISATQGEYFNTYYANTKTLTPKLKINNKNSAFPQDCLFYWFKEDASIKLNDKYHYSVYGGVGWAIQNELIREELDEEGNVRHVFDTSQQTLLVNKNSVDEHTRFKCVVLIGEKKLSSIVTLKNLNTDKILRFYPLNNTGIYTKDIGLVELGIKLYYENITDLEDFKNSVNYYFNRYNKAGTLIDDTNDFYAIEKYNEIIEEEDGKKYYYSIVSFPVYEVDVANSISCTAIVIKDGEKYSINSKEIKVSTNHFSSYNISISNDKKVFKYDADGDSPLVEEYDTPLNDEDAKIKSLDPLSYKIYNKDGIEIRESDYKFCKYTWHIPVDSMISIITPPGAKEDYIEKSEDEKYYLVSGIGNDDLLYYSIRSKYKKDYTGNRIYLSVEFDDNQIEADVQLTFIKDGDGGTNGTKYSSVIVMGENYLTGTPYGIVDEEGIPQKLKFIYNWIKKEWKIHSFKNNKFELPEDAQRKRLFVRVYENGRLLTPGIDYGVTWEMFDPNFTNPCLQTVNIDSNGGLLVTPYTYINEATGLNEYGTYGKEKNKPLTKDTTTVNIVKATIQIFKEGNKVNELSSLSQEIQTTQYAFYPIETVFTNFNLTKEEAEIYQNFNDIDEAQIIPSLRYGFSSVLYESDGSNPAWDSNENFELYVSDSYKKEFESLYSIKWTVKNNIQEEFITVKDKDGNYVTIRATDDLHLKATPYNRYNDGNSQNYVQAKCVFEDTTESKELIKALKEEQKGYLDDYNLNYLYLETENYNYNLLNSLIKYYNNSNTGYNHWLYLLDQSDTKELMKQLGFEQNIVNTLKVEKVEALRNLLDSYAIGHELGNLSNYVLDLIDLLEKFYLFIPSIRNTDDIIKYNLLITQVKDFVKDIEMWRQKYINKKFFSLEDIEFWYEEEIKKIDEDSSLTEEEKQKAKEVLLSDKDIYIYIFNSPSNKIATINNHINNIVIYYGIVFERNMIDLSKYSGFSNLNSLSSSIEDFVNIIKDNEKLLATPQLHKIKDEILIIIDKINNSCTPREILDYINVDMISLLFGTFDIIEYSAIKLSKSSENSHNEAVNYYQDALNEYSEKISQLNKTILNDGVITIITKPIIFTLNAFEMSNINGWDGNKLELGDSFLLAPQLGAGLKNKVTNTFTGMVMGVKSLNNTVTRITPETSKIGLFGYHNGKQTFCLSAKDGSAIFGKADAGQIVIDPHSKKALLYSHSYFKRYNAEGLPESYENNESGEGLLIDLTTPEIKYGNGKFILDKNGNVTIKGSDNDSEGVSTIAGWKIGKKALYSAEETYAGPKITLSSVGYKMVSKKGKPTIIEDPDKSGCLFSHNHRWLSSRDQGFYLGSDGISFGDVFKLEAVDNDHSTLEIGRLDGNHFTIGGFGDSYEHGAGNSFIKFGCDTWAEAAFPGYRDKVRDTIKEYSVYLGTDGFAIGQKFYIDNNGTMALNFSTSSKNSNLKIDKDGITVTSNSTFLPSEDNVLKGIPLFVLDGDTLYIYSEEAYESGENGVYPI